MDKIILEGFRKFLAKKTNVPENSTPYYLRWISNCYSLYNLDYSEILSGEQKKDFLNQFAQSHEDWQVRQAQDALRLFDYFMVAPPESIKRNPGKTNHKWEAIVEQTKKALRLKHRAGSTEKTYTTWLRSFSGFVADKPPEEITADDLQQFLSYLAVERKVATSTQNQALNALIFVFRHVMQINVGENELDAVRAGKESAC